jgi:membrane protein DedA with SNARE-associated domain
VVHGVFEWITSVIARLGYLGAAALTFLENVFPPIPSELVIPLAGFVAAQGDLRLALVILMGSLGLLAGAIVGSRPRAHAARCSCVPPATPGHVWLPSLNIE